MILRSIPRLTDCLKHYQLAGKEISFSECFDVDEARSADVSGDGVYVVDGYLHGSGATASMSFHDAVTLSTQSATT